MKHLPAVVLVVLLVVLPSCKYFKNGGLFGRKTDQTAVLKARQDSTRVADSIRKVEDDLQVLENEKLISARKAEEERVTLESKYMYNIIVGSFEVPEYAKELAEVYRQKGYDTKIIKMDGRRFELVSAEAYGSIGKAAVRLKEFRESIEPDAWMYIKK